MKDKSLVIICLKDRPLDVVAGFGVLLVAGIRRHVHFVRLECSTAENSFFDHHYFAFGYFQNGSAHLILLTEAANRWLTYLYR